MVDLIVELKSVVAEKIQFDVSKLSNINIDGIFQNLRTKGIVAQDTKPPIFQSQVRLLVEHFCLIPKWKNWVLYFWRKMSCNIEGIQC